jgi:hypothetical protein
MAGFKRIGALSLGLLAMACGGRGSGDSSADAGSAGASQATFSAANVQAAENACASGVDPAEAPPATTIGALRAQLVGAWWLCPDSPVPPPAGLGPIVITEDGRRINLVSDGSGGLVPGTAAADRSTYAIDTVFDGLTVVDGGPGQVLGTTTTVIVTAPDGSQTRLVADPRLSPMLPAQLWMSYAHEVDRGVWAYVQLGGP